MNTIRNPKSFQDMIINTFKSPDNYNYLYNLFYNNLLKMGVSPNIAKSRLNNLIYDIMLFSSQYGAINTIIQSDTIAMRAKGGLTLWNEVKRINLAFYKDRMNNYMNNIYNANVASYSSVNTNNVYSSNRHNTYGVMPPLPPIPNKINAKNIEYIYDEYNSDEYINVNPYNKLLDQVPIVGNVEDNEDYAMTMFISDSLQPEGYEYLNNMGPKYELLENQYWWDNRDGVQKYNPIPFNSKKKITEDDGLPFEFMLYNNGYSGENNTLKQPENYIRTAEDLIYEFMGENYVETETVLQNENRAKKLDKYAKSGNSGESSTEFMRYKEIPFWQKLSREGVDTDISDTLGFGVKESNNHVRGWNMDSVRPLSF